MTCLSSVYIRLSSSTLQGSCDGHPRSPASARHDRCGLSQLPPTGSTIHRTTHRGIEGLCGTERPLASIALSLKLGPGTSQKARADFGFTLRCSRTRRSAGIPSAQVSTISLHGQTSRFPRGRAALYKRTRHEMCLISCHVTASTCAFAPSFPCPVPVAPRFSSCPGLRLSRPQSCQPIASQCLRSSMITFSQAPSTSLSLPVVCWLPLSAGGDVRCRK